MKKLITLLLMSASLAACSRVETGEVGVRQNFSKTIETTELQPGSFNQTIIGSVLLFPVKDVGVDIVDLHPLASDNSTVADFDMQVIYSLNPQSVAEIWIEKSRSFHAQDQDGRNLLMYNYIYQVGRNAAYKVARKYESLKMNDNRAQMEQEIMQSMQGSLAKEGLGNKIILSQILIRQILPAPQIVDSANLLVQAQNEQKRKEVEVKTAKAEAERIATLNANSGAIEYMNAMALINISEAIKSGQVSTIVVPYDFKGIVNVK